MIKINLLNSVTDRQNSTVAAVDRKVSSPASRFVLMAVVVTVLMAAVIGWGRDQHANGQDRRRAAAR